MLITEVSKDLYAINGKDINNNGASAEEINQLRDCFTRCGCLVIEDMLDASYIDQLKQCFDERYGCIPESELQDKYYKVGKKRFQFTMEMTAPFSDSLIYGNPILLNVLNILLDSYVAVQSFPGAPNQNVHRDNPPLFEENVDLSERLPPYALTVIIPLVDITLECGSTALWPGSHQDLSPQYTVKEEPQLPIVKRGSAYLWDYRLVHAGAANNAQTNRPILSLVYSRRWFSDTTNFRMEPPLYISKDQYEKIPENVKFLFDRFLWDLE